LFGTVVVSLCALDKQILIGRPWPWDIAEQNRDDISRQIKYSQVR